MIGVEQVVEIRFLARQGLNVSQIARRLGLDRKTVKKKLETADAVRMEPSVPRSSLLDAYKAYLQERLRRWPELSATRLYREIATFPPLPGEEPAVLALWPAAPYAGSERTVRRYIARIRPRHERIYRPLETLPGEQAQADWGSFGFIEREGQRYRLYAFSFVLSYSRIRYVEFVLSQDSVTFLGCLLRAFQYVGGVVEQVLFDNAKTVVSARVGSVIQFNADLLRCAAQYGFRPTACWMRDPESKGKVENSIQYVRRDFFYSGRWDELEALNRDVGAWCDQVANEKVHQNTREVPADRLAEERRALAALPRSPLPLFQEVERYVRKDGTFSHETNQYSVPHAYTQRHLKIHVHPHRLVVWADHQVVAEHERRQERGLLIQDAEHYQEREAGRRQRKDVLQARFEELGPVAACFLQGLARQRQGSLREQVRQLLALAEEHGPSLVHSALERAHAFETYSFATVKRIVRSWGQHPDALPDDPRSLPLALGYRGPSIQVEQRSLADYGRLLEEVSDS